MVGVTTKGTNVTVKSAGAPSVTLSDVLFGSVFLCSGQVGCPLAHSHLALSLPFYAYFSSICAALVKLQMT